MNLRYFDFVFYQSAVLFMFHCLEALARECSSGNCPQCAEYARTAFNCKIVVVAVLLLLLGGGGGGGRGSGWLSAASCCLVVGGCWWLLVLLVAGCCLLVVGCWSLVAGCRSLVAVCCLLLVAVALLASPRFFALGPSSRLPVGWSPKDLTLCSEPFSQDRWSISL